MKEQVRNDGYIDKKETARLLRVSCRTVDTWMRKGLVPYRKVGRLVRFSWPEVSEHLKTRSRPATVPVECNPGQGIAGFLRQRAAEIRKGEVTNRNSPGQ